ncbi:MAG: carbon starvation CstA family protein, partial [bacterium]
MSAALVAVLCCTILALGYRFYGDHIAYNVTHLDASRPTPAHTMEDGVDYVPSNKWVLFGHHFASISGLGPILGPAIAVIWGWLPAVLWVVFGTLLVGAVH